MKQLRMGIFRSIIVLALVTAVVFGSMPGFTLGTSAKAITAAEEAALVPTGNNVYMFVRDADAIYNGDGTYSTTLEMVVKSDKATLLGLTAIGVLGIGMMPTNYLFGPSGAMINGFSIPPTVGRLTSNGIKSGPLVTPTDYLQADLDSGAVVPVMAYKFYIWTFPAGFYSDSNGDVVIKITMNNFTKADLGAKTTDTSVDLVMLKPEKETMFSSVDALGKPNIVQVVTTLTMGDAVINFIDPRPTITYLNSATNASDGWTEANGNPYSADNYTDADGGDHVVQDPVAMDHFVAPAGMVFSHYLDSRYGTLVAYPETLTGIKEDMQLTAYWKSADPTTQANIVYLPNGSAGEPVIGIPPTDSLHAVNTQATVLGNVGSPAMTRDGYNFVGWNTAADGSGSAYGAGDSILLTDNEQLYAMWAPIDRLAVQFVENVPAGVTVHAADMPNPGTRVDLMAPYAVGYSGTAGTNYVEATDPTLVGYQFAGWMESANGTVVVGPSTNAAMQEVSGLTANKTYYAKWTPLVTPTIEYLDTFTGNKGNWIVDNPVDATPAGTGNNITYSHIALDGVTAERFGTDPHTGWSFSHYLDSRTGKEVTAGDVVSDITADMQLTAYWQSNQADAFSILYYPNPASIDAVTGTVTNSPPVDTTAYAANASVAVLDNVNSMVGSDGTDNYTFLHWNTQPDGTGINYMPGDTLTITGNTKLYAIWKNSSDTTNTVDVSWFANLPTGSNFTTLSGMPTPSSNPNLPNPSSVAYASGDVLASDPALEGYNFNGWYATKAEAEAAAIGKNTTGVVLLTGTAASQTVTASSNYYASWIPLPTVTYENSQPQVGDQWDENGNPYHVANYTNAGGGSHTVLPPIVGTDRFNAPIGLEFSYYLDTTTGKEYSGSETITGITENRTLIAYWESSDPANNVTLLYHSNADGDGNNVPVAGLPPQDDTLYPVDSTSTVLGNTGTPPMTRAGYTFVGWNTEPDGTGRAYDAGSSILLTENTDLYAMWTPTGTLAVKFLENVSDTSILHATGMPSPSTQTSKTSGYQVGYNQSTGVTYAKATNPKLKGYTFLGWSETANGAIVLGPSTGSGAIVETAGQTTNKTYYARWILTDIPEITYLDNFSGTPTVDTWVTNNPVEADARDNVDNTAFIYSHTVLDATDHTTETRFGPHAGFEFSHYLDNNGFIRQPDDLLDYLEQNMTLTAYWTSSAPNQYSVMYYPNPDGDGADVPVIGNPPVDSNTYDSGDIVTVNPQTGIVNLSREGYTFLHWNTQPDGLGTNVMPGDTFTISSDTALYAVWKKNDTTDPVNTLDVSWFANLPDGVVASQVSNMPSPATNTNLPVGTVIAYVSGDVTAKDPQLAGYTFYGWYESKVEANAAAAAKDRTNAVLLSDATALQTTQTIDASKAYYAAWVLYPTVTYENSEPQTGDLWDDTNGNPYTVQSYTYASGGSHTVQNPTGTNHFVAPTNKVFSHYLDSRNGQVITTTGSTLTAIADDMALTAYWVSANPAANGASVSYLPNPPNGATVIGAPPLDTNLYTLGTNAVVKDNATPMTCDGYNFVGWNTQPNGSGLTYNAANNLLMTDNTQLYAVWEPVDQNNNKTAWTVKFLENLPVDATEHAQQRPAFSIKTDMAQTGYQVGYNNPFSVTYAAATDPTLVDYRFKGWAESTTGAVVLGPSTDTSAVLETASITADKTYYAQWEKLVTPKITYLDNFDGTPDTGNWTASNPVDATINGTGNNITYSHDALDGETAAHFGTVPHTGWTFSHYLDSRNGQIVDVGDVLTGITEDMSLTAYWESSDPSQFSIVYFPNPGTDGVVVGNPPVDSTTYTLGGSQATVKSDNGMYRDGYTFLQWNTEPDGTGINYRPGDLTTVVENMQLYAIWKNSNDPNGNDIDLSWFANLPAGTDASMLSNMPTPAAYPNLPNPTTVAYTGGDIAATDPTLEGYTFYGWYASKAAADSAATSRNTTGALLLGDGTSGQLSNTIATSTTYYAAWQTELNLDLTLQKMVAGAAGDTTKAFAFQVNLFDKNGVALPDTFTYVGTGVGGVTAPADGSIANGGTVSLKNGQSIVISGLPEGAKVTITEVDPADYSITTVNDMLNAVYSDANRITSGDMGQIDRSVTYQNTRDQITPTGTFLTIWPYVLLALLAIAGTVVMVMKRGRKQRYYEGL